MITDSRDGDLGGASLRKNFGSKRSTTRRIKEDSFSSAINFSSSNYPCRIKKQGFNHWNRYLSGYLALDFRGQRSQEYFTYQY